MGRCFFRRESPPAFSEIPQARWEQFGKLRAERGASIQRTAPALRGVRSLSQRPVWTSTRALPRGTASLQSRRPSGSRDTIAAAHYLTSDSRCLVYACPTDSARKPGRGVQGESVVGIALSSYAPESWRLTGSSDFIMAGRWPCGEVILSLPQNCRTAPEFCYLVLNQVSIGFFI